MFLDAARADYAARLAPTGLSLEKIREITRAWRQAVGESASTGARILPEGMERLFEDAFREAFTVGVARVFAVAALVGPGVRDPGLVRPPPGGGPDRHDP